LNQTEYFEDTDYLGPSQTALCRALDIGLLLLWEMSGKRSLVRKLGR